MKVQVDVLGSLSLIVSPYGFCGRKTTFKFVKAELRICVRVKVAVLGALSLTVLTVSVDVKQH